MLLHEGAWCNRHHGPEIDGKNDTHETTVERSAFIRLNPHQPRVLMASSFATRQTRHSPEFIARSPCTGGSEEQGTVVARRTAEAAFRHEAAGVAVRIPGSVGHSSGAARGYRRIVAP